MSSEFKSLWSLPELQSEGEGSAPTAAGEVLSFPESGKSAPDLSLVEPAGEDTLAQDPAPVSDELQALIDAAREEGRAEGQTQGRAEAEAEAQARLEEELLPELEETRARNEELRQLLEGLTTVTQQEREALADQATQICAALARRVLSDSLLYSPALLSELVTSSLSRFPGDSGIQVRVPPERLDQVRADLGTLEVEVLGDPAIEGGCLIRNEGAEVDRRLSALMAGLDEALQGLVP